MFCGGGEKDRSQRREVEGIERQRTYSDTVGDKSDRRADGLLGSSRDV